VGNTRKFKGGNTKGWIKIFLIRGWAWIEYDIAIGKKGGQREKAARAGKQTVIFIKRT